MFKESSPSFQRTASVRNRIANDADAKKLLLQMVSLGIETLKHDCRYKNYRQALESIIENDANFRKYLERSSSASTNDSRIIPSFLICAFTTDGEDGEYIDPKVMRKHVDALIEETVRFLGMKILMDSELADTEVRVTESVVTSKRKNKVVLQLCPSEPVRASWRTLLLFPITYADVCRSMGSNGNIDYMSETAGIEQNPLFKGELSRKMWSMECYEWTLRTYEMLYNGAPSSIFWPSTTMKDRMAVENREPEWGLRKLSRTIRETAQKPCRMTAEEEDEDDDYYLPTPKSANTETSRRSSSRV